jgi:hypothetical protein
LAIIRSALMSSGANNTSILMTGSIREALKMMLEDSAEPIFGEAHQVELPPIDAADFIEYLDFNFTDTGRACDEAALVHLVELTNCHPKRTQQLAWGVWQALVGLETPRVDVDVVQATYEEMLAGTDSREFETTLQMLSFGGDAEANEMRALYLLADRPDSPLTSRQHLALYGFTNASLILPAIQRLEKKGLSHKRGERWQIVDPFFEGWLRSPSPRALKPGDASQPLPADGST